MNNFFYTSTYKMQTVFVSQVTAIVPKLEGVDCTENALMSVLKGECNVRALPRGESVHIGAVLPPFNSMKALQDLKLPNEFTSIASETCKYAVAAGLLALEEVGLISRHSQPPWVLREEMQDSTGIIFASSFAHHDGAIANASSYLCKDETNSLLDQISHLLTQKGIHGDVLSSFRPREGVEKKIALQLLLDANVQLAQIVKAKGVNTYCTNACASTTSAIKFASNSIQLGDADRILVIAADTPLSQGPAKVIPASFATMKAASTASSVSAGVRPFSDGRNGFVFGDAAVAILLERETTKKHSIQVLTSRIANSAYHGTRLDVLHISKIMKEVFLEVCQKQKLSISEFCAQTMYISHETFTKTCALAEVEALEQAIGRDALQKLTITNTKAYLGHCMGVCMEDAIAVVALQSDIAPKVDVSNLSSEFSDLCFANGETRPYTYAVHLACGMGSHVVVVVYAKGE